MPCRASRLSSVATERRPLAEEVLADVSLSERVKVPPPPARRAAEGVADSDAAFVPVMRMALW